MGFETPNNESAAAHLPSAEEIAANDAEVAAAKQRRAELATAEGCIPSELENDLQVYGRQIIGIPEDATPEQLVRRYAQWRIEMATGKKES